VNGSDQSYDVAVIGGGINGAGIAFDAAGRGARVLLLEKGDLASGTSSSSTKLIHGGLRYLEHYEFALVREALKERETLWRIAPHVIRPLRLVLPAAPGMAAPGRPVHLRPSWRAPAACPDPDRPASQASRRRGPAPRRPCLRI
jgi:glycerol-3-phosphate dehydrogenase